MKRFGYNIITAIALVTIVSFSACDKLFGTEDNFLKGTFNEELIEWNGVAVSVIEADTFPGILIQAITTNSLSNIETFTLGLASFDGEGTYAIDLESSNLATYLITSKDVQNQYISKSGSIVVTSYKDEVIEGTFSFELINKEKEVIIVKDGSFLTKKLF